MSEWEQRKLGEICTFQRGHDLPKTKMIAGDYPVAGSNSIIGYHNSYTTNGPSLTIGRSGNIGTPYFYENKFWAHNTVLYVKEFIGSVPKYLYYLLKTIDFSQYNAGSAVPTLNRNHIYEHIVSVPPLPEQHAIAEVLSSLDDKIDLLHRNNKTLEEMAETLFRQWFLDTEFNSTINDVAEVLNGYAFKSSEFSSEGKNYVIKIKNIGGSSVNISDCDRISDNTANKTNNKFKVLSGDVLFAMTGAELGKMGVVGSTTRSLWLNQRVGSIKDRFNGSRYLAYLALNSELGQDFILNTASGSAQPNISGVDISRCPFPSISLEQIEEKSEVLNNLFDKVIHNLGQISILKETRDTLLPKLMSGQVRVKTH